MSTEKTWLPGLTGQRAEAVRTAEAGLSNCNLDVCAKRLRDAFPEVFADDDFVTATWKPGDSDDVWAEFRRVARMEGASIMATQSGVTYSGSVAAANDDHISIRCTSIGNPTLSIPQWGAGWTATVTAPIDPTGGDPVVMAIIEGCISHRIMFRARDGRWVTARDAMIGAWDTAELSGITRLTPETIAELMGGAS